MPAPGSKPDLRVVQGGTSVCGYPTASGDPCQRPSAGLCWQHEDEPEPQDERYPPPEHLGEHGRAYWRQHLPLLVKKGVVTTLELPAFTTLCELFESKHRCYLEWKDATVNPVTDRGPKKSPAWTMYQQAEREYRMMLESFGLTPTTRRKLGLDDKKQARGVDAIRNMK